MRCWGPNDEGQLGDGTRVARSRPVPVRGLHDVVRAAVGPNRTCAIQRSGAVVCWGAGETQWATVPGLHATALALGDEHACAITAEGV